MESDPGLSTVSVDSIHGILQGGSSSQLTSPPQKSGIGLNPLFMTKGEFHWHLVAFAQFFWPIGHFLRNEAGVGPDEATVEGAAAEACDAEQEPFHAGDIYFQAQGLAVLGERRNSKKSHTGAPDS